MRQMKHIAYRKITVFIFIFTLSLDFVLGQGSDNEYYGNGGYQYREDRSCYPGTRCTSLYNCPLIRELMDRKCLATEKLRDIICGYRNTEPQVCCPRGGEYNVAPIGTNEYYGPSGTNIGNNYLHSTRPEYDSYGKGSSNINLNCGQSLVRPTTNDNRLGVQPWVVRVGFINTKTGSINYACLGSIISRTVILTSAYCAKGSDEDNFLSSVQVGEYDYNSDPDCTEDFCATSTRNYQVERAIVHPDYDQRNYKNNVALLKLNDTIVYSLTAQPICILQSGRIPLVGRTGLLIGWGKVTNNNGEETTSSRQQQLELPIVPLEKCIRMYEQKIPITSEHLCVGGESKNDACTGFTGAPLILLDHYTFQRYYLVGIVSFGTDKCGKDGFPSIYTSIHFYAQWIRNNM